MLLSTPYLKLVACKSTAGFTAPTPRKTQEHLASCIAWSPTTLWIAVLLVK